MNSEERVLNTLQRKEVDRIPTFEWSYDKKLINIYWIVNNSNDKSLSILHDFRKKYENEYNSIIVEIYNNSDNPAESRADDIRDEYMYGWLSIIRNKILKKCISLKCDFLFSCDSDILVRPDTLKISLSHNKHIVASLLYNGYLHEGIENAYKYPNILKEISPRNYTHIINNRVKFPEKQSPEKLIECDFTGACVLISQEACKHTKYEYHRQGEDEPFSYYLRQAGFYIFCVPFLFQKHCMSEAVLNYFIQNKLVEEIKSESRRK